MKVERVSLAVASLFLGLFALGCREHNPAYIQVGSPPDALPSRDTSPSPDGPARDTKTPDGGTLSRDGSRADVGDANVGLQDGQSDTPSRLVDGGDSFDVAPADARDARDGREVGNGDGGQSPPVDGSSESRSDAASEGGVLVDGAKDVPFSSDGLVGDGGVADVSEVGVVIVIDAADVDTNGALDSAVDSAPACLDGDTRSCVSAANPLVGACHAGTQTCVGGTWGLCNGETLPAATESCNGIDDNCNGMTDEGCALNCVVVSPTGDDTTGDGTVEHPFATLQTAINFAVQPDGGVAGRVCVSGGATCTDSFVYNAAAPLAMANGVLVHGNYALAATGLAYCSGTQPPTTTIQFVASPLGVVFDASIASHTELGGFAIQRFSPSNGASLAGPISAVQVVGGKNITLSGILVSDAPVADTTYGVDVGGGGQVTIVGSSIGGGQGRVTAVGVHVDGGSVVLRNNCDSVTQGICQSDCSAPAGGLGIRGRRAVTTAADTSATSSAVTLGNSSALPSPPSTIIANTLCGGSGITSNAGRGANVVALECDSGGCATVSGNNITGGRGAQVVAVSVAGGGVLVDGNVVSGGCGTDSTTGLALSDSSARVQNNRVFGGQCPGNPSSTFVGLSVVLGPSSAEPEVHSNDIDPMGGTIDCQSTGVTIDRAAGDNVPAGVYRNNIILAGDCPTRFGVVESATASARLVENNDLYGSPATSVANSPAVLYHRASTDAMTATQVNSLAGAVKNLASDPRFVAYATDLHLTVASPCIDQGTPATAPATDGDGKPRPAGNGFDMGAFEFSSP